MPEVNPVDAGVSPALQAAYDEQYSEAMTEWRELGGKYKAANILEVCRGQRFNRVLDCGAGEGSVLKHLDAAGVFDELYATDISESGIARIRARPLPRLKEARKFDGYTIPFPDRAFDLAICCHVLEHVEHPRILLRELRRVSAFQVFEIPLDYAPGVDGRVGDMLAYGHINIYTPSLFRFLLRSEGFEILSERLTHQAAEVVRFNWYRNQKRQRSVLDELRLGVLALHRIWARLWWGRRRFEEFGYTAYTCLAKGAGDLRILR